MKTAALLLLLLLADCQSIGGTWCDISDPIRLSDPVVDAMSDAEVTAALAHNKKGEKLCGWTP